MPEKRKQQQQQQYTDEDILDAIFLAPLDGGSISLPEPSVCTHGQGHGRRPARAAVASNPYAKLCNATLLMVLEEAERRHRGDK